MQKSIPSHFYVRRNLWSLEDFNGLELVHLLFFHCKHNDSGCEPGVEVEPRLDFFWGFWKRNGAERTAPGLFGREAPQFVVAHRRLILWKRKKNQDHSTLTSPQSSILIISFVLFLYRFEF
ncbi:hypothetical protein C0J52_10041 [Blattella germanica]|nr:hypothetical protein C0J52_10041 [Blattella germanica]